MSICTSPIFIVNILYKSYPFFLKRYLVIKTQGLPTTKKVRRDGLVVQNWDIIKGTFQNTSSMKLSYFKLVQSTLTVFKVLPSRWELRKSAYCLFQDKTKGMSSNN